MRKKPTQMVEQLLVPGGTGRESAQSAADDKEYDDYRNDANCYAGT